MIDQEPLLDEVIDVATHESGLVTRCRFRLFAGVDGAPVVVVTELAENRGLSVTNAAENVWRAIAGRLDTARFTMVERYDAGSYDRAEHHEETFDLVTVTNGKPGWQHPRRSWPAQAGCPLELTSVALPYSAWSASSTASSTLVGAWSTAAATRPPTSASASSTAGAST